LWPEGGRVTVGDAVVTLRRPLVPVARTSGPFRNPVDFSFAIDWDAVVFVGLTDPQAARTVRRIDLAPIAVVPASRRPEVGSRLVGVDVTAPAAFRPAEVEPGSDDRRSLGCQVRIELQ